MPRVNRTQSTNGAGSAIAVERAVDILFLLAETEEMSIADVSRTMRISGNAVHRILTALKRKNLVDQDARSDRYRLAGGVLRLRRSWMEYRRLREAAWPEMVALRDKTEETVVLVIRSADKRICIDQVESKQDVRWEISIGRIDPLHAGATGKVFLAHLSPQERTDYFSKSSRIGVLIEGIKGKGRLDSELDRVVQLGYAVNDEERTYAPGVAGLAAPIYDEYGRCAAVLSISVPVQRWSQGAKRRSIPLLLEAARRISYAVGGAERPASVHDKMDYVA